MSKLPSSKGLAVDDWMSTFEGSLSSLPASERSDIVAELRLHLAETGETPATAFGEPMQYAERFVADPRRVGATPEPRWVWLRWVARIAALPMAIVLELIGLMLLMTIGFELLQPEDTGLFVQDGTVTAFGIDTEPSGTEVLGAWLIPACLLIGGPLSYAGLRLFDWIRNP
ncbi:MAG: hypothetical protein AAGA48_11505 [Myxococcota bacterium]